ncbi:SDR family NAD(P)-dependent oxidoreductase [Sphingobium nicotianae]|uniref:SDR family NAD(P)-dependent oxidoreductase n=1 Tax=Sphingobium nicotianae TaxID=2782607 RepID=A0A9X1DFI3_9SPHN|nr:SDR family NAD(P)-dependent oxidoreductase [Sphingobium nicotianae]MBT2188568.1 SDR family NAD(P)-dependent oxidoreductase [Sphingobium nicotianae]
MPHLLIFGLGYTAARLARRLAHDGWQIEATGAAGTIRFDDDAAVAAALRRATHILSSVPPVDARDPVLDRYGDAIRATPAGWIGYLSATGVYGDTGGAWVDEASPVGHGRRNARTTADLAWQALGRPVHLFRPPGIYGPGRSALDRIADGRARRIDLPGQIFSRIHVDDIVSGVIAGMAGPAGLYNLADDHPCPQNDVIAHAAALLGIPPPPLQSLDAAQLSPAAAAFYAENRRIANGRAKRLLGWAPLYRDYRAGLAACLAETRMQGNDHAAERQGHA